MPVDTKYIAACALDYANVPQIDRRYIASVHLENDSDKSFWESVLQKNRTGQYNYIYESRVEKDGSLIRGVHQCLRYKPYLSKTFFVCIDSDLRYLQQELDIDADHFILQTYTYSWENHYCLAEQIQNRLKELSQEKSTEFDFVYFLNQLSKMAYEPLLYLLEASSQKLISNSAIGQFHKCIPSQCTAEVFKDNGTQLLDKICSDLQLFASNPLFDRIDIDIAKEKYLQLGLREENTYLHLRGHNVFNLVAHIGKMLYSPFKAEVLVPSLKLEGYWEIDKIAEDIKSII